MERLIQQAVLQIVFIFAGTLILFSAFDCRGSDSSGETAHGGSDFRSGFLRIELWISTKTIRSGRSQTGAALYQTRLSSLYRYGSCEILRQSPARCPHGQSCTESV